MFCKKIDDLIIQALFDLQLGIRINQVHSKVPESPKSNHKDYDSYIQTLTPEIIYAYAYSYN